MKFIKNLVLAIASPFVLLGTLTFMVLYDMWNRIAHHYGWIDSETWRRRKL